MGHGFDRIKELFRDNYKTGVERGTPMPILYLDPTRITGWDANVLREKLEVNPSTGKYSFDRLTKTERTFLAERVREQFEEQIPSITKNLSEKDLIIFLANSLERGPFSNYKTIPGVCIINHQKDGEIDPDNIFKTFKIEKDFKPDHLLPLPGSVSDWRRLTGEHEGEHCNQGHIERSGEHGHLAILTGEALSDRKALQTLRDEGKDDVAQAWIDLRVLAAASGDTHHATSIFLDKDEEPNITQAHYDAAEQFVNDMNEDVARKLGISMADAEKLRKEDPQRYATEVEEALQTGKIPKTSEPIGLDASRVLIAERLGTSLEEFDKLGEESAARIAETYDQLEKESAFMKDRKAAPFVKEYIEQYVGAVRRRFIPDTTPDANAKQTITADATPAADHVIQSEQELVGAMSDDDMQYAAQYQLSDALSSLVAKELGITADAARKLNDKDYITALEKVLPKEGTIVQARYDRPVEDHNTIMAQKLGISLRDVETMDDNKHRILYSAFLKSDSFSFKYDNPYLTQAIKGYLGEQNLQQNKTSMGIGSYDYLADQHPEMQTDIAVAEITTAQPAFAVKKPKPAFQPSAFG